MHGLGEVGALCQVASAKLQTGIERGNMEVAGAGRWALGAGGSSNEVSWELSLSQDS